MKFFEKVFHLKEKNTTIRQEIVGGLFTFVAMCYILPVNSAILSDMGMNKAGVFAMTALVGAAVTILMGLVANYPITLSAGMGLNAYISYTVSSQLGYTWNQSMILLTVSGILFFVLSLTPIRKKIIESILKDLKYMISASLGAFICIVGLKNSGVIVSNSSTLVGLGNFADPATLIAILSIILCFGLMAFRNPKLSAFAIPIAVVIAAIAGVITSTIMIKNGSLSIHTNEFIGEAYDPLYNKWTYIINGTEVVTNLPIAPWLDSNVSFGVSGIKEVLFYGLLTDSYSGQTFANDLGAIFSNPASYIAIFSLTFINLFDTTATLVTVSRSTGIIGEDDKIQNYRSVILADATGAMICAPLGTSTVTSFAESSVGVSMGAKTGLAALASAFFFILSAFIYPVFSIFTAGSVTASALVCVGAMIFANNFQDINFKDKILGFTGFIMVIFSVLCYSVASGIGIALFVYIAMMLVSKRGKEISLPIYIIAVLFLISFALTTITPLLQK